jgi:HPt (histidine-containing phosphotransfer) domain-containing protein
MIRDHSEKRMGKDEQPGQHPSWIDLGQLRRHTQDDRALESELLGLFRVQARLQLNVISIARKPADYRLAIHSLKGAALAIGAKPIAATAAELEAIGLTGDAAMRRRLMKTLADQVTATLAEIAEITGGA